MRYTRLFDYETKIAVISTHGWYEFYVRPKDGGDWGDPFQRGSTDELGLIYDFCFDDLVCHPPDIPREEVERRLSIAARQTEEERYENVERERAKYLLDFGWEFTGGWGQMGFFSASEMSLYELSGVVWSEVVEVGKRATAHFRTLALQGVRAEQAIITASQLYYEELGAAAKDKWSPDWVTRGGPVPAEVVTSWKMMVSIGTLPDEVKARLLAELEDYGRAQDHEAV